MSKSNIRKITVDPTKCNIDSRRPSVFERLGTKPAVTTAVQNASDYCRNWALNGSCSYGKSCKYANTHTLISPSKRVKKDNAPTNPPLLIEDPFKRLTSKIVKTTSHSPDLNLEEWNQTDLEYEDEKVLERRRQLLQRELELQMKKDKEVHGKDKLKYKKKAMSSSSSSHSSSSSSTSSSSSSDDSSSSSTSDSRKKVKKFKKTKRSASPEFDEDKERKKKLKLKRLASQNEKLPPKKKRKIDVPPKKDLSPKSIKKPNTSIVPHKQFSTPRAKSPLPSASHALPPKSKDRPRSESPKLKVRELEKDRHHKKRESDELAKEMTQKKTVDRADRVDRTDRTDRLDRGDRTDRSDRADRSDRKDVDKSKSRPLDDKSKNDDRSKPRSKDRDRRSRTPLGERSKHLYLKDNSSNKSSKRSRSPDKSRSKHEPSSSRHQDKGPISRRSRELDKRDRDSHKRDRSKDRDDGRKLDQSKSKSSQDEHRKNSSRDLDDKSYSSDRNRQRSKERRDKEHGGRDDRSHSRMSRDNRDSQRDKDREDRDRRGDRERDRDSNKPRDRDLLLPSSNSLDKNSRYRSSDKDRPKDLGSDKNSRDRRSERDKDRPESKSSDARDRGSRSFDARYDRPLDKELPLHKSERDRDRDRSERGERFPRERSIDRPPLDKTGDRLLERDRERDRDSAYDRDRERDRDRDRHRRYGARFDPKDAHGLSSSIKLDRRESPRRNLDVDRNFERGYSRLAPPPPPPPPEHWDEQEEADYREHHGHEDERRKPVEARRYNSPFNERRGRADERSQSRYPPSDRPFEEVHHPLYAGDKIRPAAIRDEATSENWDVHHDMEHAGRERPYPSAEWDEREWRGRAMWDRESLPRSEAHEEEWSTRYDTPISEWKVGEPRKWDNQPLHVRGSYRNERLKELELSDHSKRRPFNTPERREELPAINAKQALQHSMKDEPINKKLMELAEGRPRRSREKSADSFQKKLLPKEKPEVKEPLLPPEPKRPCLEEPLPSLHTESDLSDISDDPDDILNMEDEVTESKTNLKKSDTDRDSASVKSQELSHSSPKPPLDESVFTKDKENTDSYSNKNNIEEESMETMDFEEISDGELEEDVKTSCKGLGDALGVDWESLVKESQPRRLTGTSHDNAQDRWQCKAVFQRIGISVKAAGHELVEKLLNKYTDNESNKLLLSNVAFVHTALARKQLLPNSTYKLISNDDILYRNKSEVDLDDIENLKPCTSLYEEAKLLLQQTA